ncbi:MAG: hypothetical protein V2A73_18340 [Pseudomonadota bacterium]
MATAGVEGWQISEVSASRDGDQELRFIELYAPPSDGIDNCFYQTTRIEVSDKDGNLLGSETPFMTTLCYPGNTYFFLSTTKAAQLLGVPRDAPLKVKIPLEAGQICLVSSTTPYDCVRWGEVAKPMSDISAPDDISTAVPLVDGKSLARMADTGVVAKDFVLKDPSPRQPNDGGVWVPPDGGPDAEPLPDAAPLPDAPEEIFADAPPRPKIDGAGMDPRYYSADPGGGAMLSCRVDAGRASAKIGLIFGVALAVLVLSRLRRRRRGSC